MSIDLRNLLKVFTCWPQQLANEPYESLELCIILILLLFLPTVFDQICLFPRLVLFNIVLSLRFSINYAILRNMQIAIPANSTELKKKRSQQ